MLKRKATRGNTVDDHEFRLPKYSHARELCPRWRALVRSFAREEPRSLTQVFDRDAKGISESVCNSARSAERARPIFRAGSPRQDAL